MNELAKINYYDVFHKEVNGFGDIVRECKWTLPATRDELLTMKCVRNWMRRLYDNECGGWILVTQSEKEHVTEWDEMEDVTGEFWVYFEDFSDINTPEPYTFRTVREALKVQEKLKDSDQCSVLHVRPWASWCYAYGIYGE